MIGLIVIGIIVGVFALTVFVGAPYVPSHSRDVARLFEALRLGKKDYVVDIGSGDGRVLRQAMRRGARATGYEINPLLALISKLLDVRSDVRLANFWTANLPRETTLVYAFSVKRDRKRLEQKVQREANRLGRPLRLACYGSPLAGRRPDEVVGAFSIYRFNPLQSKKAQV